MKRGKGERTAEFISATERLKCELEERGEVERGASAALSGNCREAGGPSLSALPARSN